jgi:hypothetical protein
MTALPSTSSQIERLRAWAREFADAIESIAVETRTRNPFHDESWARAFWTVLVTLVVDDTSLPIDLTDDELLATYAAFAATEFLLDQAVLG